MHFKIFASFCLLSIVLCDYGLPHQQHSIRRIDHYSQKQHHPYHLGQRLLHRQPVPARSVRHIPSLNPLRGIFNLVDQSRRRSQRVPTRLIKSKGHPRRPVSNKVTQPRVVPNFIYLNAEQMPGYEKFGDHEIVRNGKTTESPYLVKSVKTSSNYSGLIDERTPKTNISSDKDAEKEEKKEKKTEKKVETSKKEYE
eukprot:TRINITY_DN7481_c0_g1_i1.p1 TRINITY_DN7481_c0_g1~~TRINITY_DN7481_c0_g1_i1.p1  ORF type:complete len:196 (+),score=42.94 TRINITY_DN7481_c0_g1_i1:39-626(+)